MKPEKTAPDQVDVDISTFGHIVIVQLHFSFLQLFDLISVSSLCMQGKDQDLFGIALAQSLESVRLALLKEI